MKYYFLNNHDALVRLNDFAIIDSLTSTLPKAAAFEGDYVPQESIVRNQFTLTYKSIPPQSPFRLVCADFTFYDCEIVAILPVEQTVSGVIGDPQITGESQREDLTKMMIAADDAWSRELSAPD